MFSEYQSYSGASPNEQRRAGVGRALTRNCALRQEKSGVRVMDALKRLLLCPLWVAEMGVSVFPCKHMPEAIHFG